MFPDPRITIVKSKINSLANRVDGDLQAPGTQSELAFIIDALDSLTEELASCLQQQQEQDSRIGSLLDVLLKYTLTDFSVKCPVSEKGDGIDALAAGLNVLGEELQYTTGKLKESEAKLRTIVTKAPDAIVTINGAGLITTWNPAAEAIFGWNEMEVLGKPVHEIIIPEAYREKHIQGFAHYLKTGDGPVLNKTLALPALCKDGLTIDIELTISPTNLYDEYLFIAFLRDISDRKKAEAAMSKLTATLEERVLQRTQALQNSEEKYRHLFERSPLPMWLLELPSCRYLDVNESAIRHYGYSREEFLSMTAIDIRPEEDRERYQKLAHPDLVGTRKMGTWRHQKKDGSIIYVEVNVHDINYEGKSARLVVANDITEKLRYEEALRFSEARFRHIFESKLIGFLFWDASGEIADANDYFLEIIGYSREDLRDGKLRWSSISPPEYNASDQLAMAQIASTGVCEPYEKEYIRKDGTRVPVMLGAASLAEEEGNMGVAYVMDISQRKKMENEILELNKELEKRVLLRTEQLELVNKELESFSYSVSHDLRAPLRAIHGFSRILLEDYLDKLDDEGARLLHTVMRNAKKMGLLVDELLEFSRLGKRELSKSVIDLNEIVEEVTRELSQTSSNPTNLTVQPLGQAVADYTLIKLVYQNLLMNAIKYSSKKEAPEIKVGVLEQDGTKTYYVKDNGAGFDMAYYDKLFGVFQRLHRQDEFEGIGVGLAIVQRIIAKHGGRIWAEGKLNEGAIFYFTLEKQ